MASDAPKIHGFTFTHHPNQSVYWQPQLVKHTLADGQTVIYNKGFILKGVLDFSESWINEDEYSNVCAMYNQLTSTAHYYPKPNSFPSNSFNVQFTNEFNFVPHGGHLQGKSQFYEGSIEFESSLGEITATARSIF